MENLEVQDSILEKNPQLLAVMLAALKDHPDAAGLSDEALCQIGEDAIREARTNDTSWLIQRLRAAHGGEGNGSASIAADAAKANPAAKLPEVQPSAVVQPESQEDLERLASQHAGWIDSVLHPSREPSGGRANFSGADLRAFDLSGLDFRGAIFSGANLEGSHIVKANLTTALLREANLKGVNFDQTKLRRADFTDAHIDGARFVHCDLKRAIWQGVDIKSAELLEPAIDP